jgi:predicted nucleic acid-binding protein
MNIFLDTNVIVDVLSKRSGYEASLDCLLACEAGLVRGFVSTSSITDIVYILRKYISPEKAKMHTENLLTYIEMAIIEPQDIIGAFSHHMKDFEDAILALCARRYAVDYIVTRDSKDFLDSPVPAIAPPDFLRLLQDTAPGTDFTSGRIDLP